MSDFSHMEKIKKNNLKCPNCDSTTVDVLALSAITGIFMCTACHESFGIKWLSASDIRKIKETKEYRRTHKL